jgi:hypothetical protein
MTKIKPTHVSFEIAKFLKEKNYDLEFEHFYTTPNSKMFAYDEHFRVYSIKNISKKLYKIGEHVTINNKNVIPAPEQHQVVNWLLENHKIWITVTSISQESWQWHITKPGDSLGKLYEEDFNDPIEAYNAAFEYIKNNNII